LGHIKTLSFEYLSPIVRAMASYIAEFGSRQLIASGLVVSPECSRIVNDVLSGEYPIATYQSVGNPIFDIYPSGVRVRVPYKYFERSYFIYSDGRCVFEGDFPLGKEFGGQA